MQQNTIKQTFLNGIPMGKQCNLIYIAMLNRIKIKIQTKWEIHYQSGSWRGGAIGGEVKWILWFFFFSIVCAIN